MKPKLAILIGDYGGVGPEIITKLIDQNVFKNYCIPIFIGNKNVLDRTSEICNIKNNLDIVNSVEDIGDTSVFYNISDKLASEFPIGEVNILSGKESLKQMQIGIDLCQENIVSGICYAPFNKTNLKLAGNKFDSEIHYMANLFGDDGEVSEINVLGEIWSTRVTSHVPISEVSNNLSIEKVYSIIKFAYENQSRYTDDVRIGVCALNPHCGENGLCGTEEIEIISPAIKKAQEDGLNVTGPISADILFIKAFEGIYNSTVTMYHDQGQIALKLNGFMDGVTVGGGLSYPVTTCAHGTAFDIAGKNIVSTSSFENALKIISKMII